MVDRELTRNQYDVPNENARRRAWAASLGRQVFLYVFLAPFVFGAVWIAFHPPFGPGHFAVWGTVLVAVAVFGWAAYWAWRSPWYEETLPSAIVMRYELGIYYAPNDRVQPLVDAVEWNYEAAGVLDGGEWPTIWDGGDPVVVDVTIDPPSPPQRPLPEDHPQQLPEDEEPRELVDGDTVVGLAYPGAGYIRIYGPYLLKLSAFGYELSHIVDDYLWPNQPEGVDLERGRDLGIRPLEWPEGKK